MKINFNCKNFIITICFLMFFIFGVSCIGYAIFIKVNQNQREERAQVEADRIKQQIIQNEKIEAEKVKADLELKSLLLEKAKSELQNSDSAQFAEVRLIKDYKYKYITKNRTETETETDAETGLCGKVNVKDSYGNYVGYKPFVILIGGRFESASEEDGEDKYESYLFLAKYLGCISPELAAFSEAQNAKNIAAIVANYMSQKHSYSHSYNLSTTDKLDSWRNASDSERVRLSDTIIERAERPGLGASELNNCISNTAGDGGLDYLTISQTAAVCILQKK